MRTNEVAQELAGIVAAAGSSMTPAVLGERLARVAASAAPLDSPDWVEMILPGAGPEVAARLRTVRQELAARPASAWSPARVAAIRATLDGLGLTGFVLPLADEHLGEFRPAAAQRLVWLTGFTGSAGDVVVHRDVTALFVDGRYVLQAAQEIDAGAVEVRHFRKPPPLEWLTGRLTAGERIGYDPRITSAREADRLTKALAEAGATAVAVDVDPIDALWTDRPPQPLAPAVPHPLENAGVAADDKIAALAAELAQAGHAATVLCQLESVAWLLNVRGADVANTPLVQGYVVLHADGRADFYVDPLAVTPALAEHLGNRVEVRDLAVLADGLAQVAAGGARIGLDLGRANAWVRDRLAAAGATVVAYADPVLLPRARKNPVEIAGMRAAHRRDAVAIALFLRWVTETARTRPLTELDAVAELERLRARDPRYRGASFDTIAGAGPNGAIVHYRPTPQTNRIIAVDNLLLVDSGGQYLDGTTDITRTVAIGTPSEAMRRHFTLVLKAHIAVATARFPAGATGAQIDPLARQHLWREGLDYDHGTGHGVGAYLGVHEGPQRISSADTTRFEPGMVLSNEPGLYLADRYGIRIENLELVREAPGLKGFLAFEPLTFAPIDRALVEPTLMDRAEIAWLDAYHAQVQALVAPQLPADAAAWLTAATRPLGGHPDAR